MRGGLQAAALGQVRTSRSLTPATWDTAGRRITASFLYNATRSLLEEAGFSYSRPKGMHH